METRINKPETGGELRGKLRRIVQKRPDDGRGSHQKSRTRHGRIFSLIDCEDGDMLPV